MLGFANIKSRLKRWLLAHPRLWSMYQQTKQQVRRIWSQRYFLYDVVNCYGHMFWSPRELSQRPLSAELLFQYHKLEKGLSLPAPRRFFGEDPANRVIDLVQRWRAASLDTHDPIYSGALSALLSYGQAMRPYADERGRELLRRIDELVRDTTRTDESFDTPVRYAPRSRSSVAAPVIDDLAHDRRSVREFRGDAVPLRLIEEAIKVAQLSPSVCNRQAVSAFVFENRDAMNALLAHQNGNRGFGHLIPCLVAITSDERCFFDATERHQPYVDGGLFTMAFLFGLQARGVSSCCLNWCVTPTTDRAAHRVSGIPDHHRIIMLIAVGFAAEGCVVPRSPRRARTEALQDGDDHWAQAKAGNGASAVA